MVVTLDLSFSVWTLSQNSSLNDREPMKDTPAWLTDAFCGSQPFSPT